MMPSGVPPTPTSKSTPVSGRAYTESIVMRSRSGTVRKIISEHQLHKLRAYSTVDYET